MEPLYVELRRIRHHEHVEELRLAALSGRPLRRPRGLRRRVGCWLVGAGLRIANGSPLPSRS